MKPLFLPGGYLLLVCGIFATMAPITLPAEALKTEAALTSPPDLDYAVSWLEGAPIMRTTFDLPSTRTLSSSDDSDVILRMSGLGWSYAVVDGVRVDPTRQLDPGWTYYKDVALVSTFNLTGLLLQNSTTTALPQQQPHTLEVHLGGGHFASDWDQGSSECILYAEVLTNNNKTTLRSSADVDQWQCTHEGPVRQATLYGGEFYDARREFYIQDPAAWVPCRAAINISSWNPPSNPFGSTGLYDRLPQKLVHQEFEPIREHEHFAPIDHWWIVEEEGAASINRTYFDFGQNFAGVLRVQVTGCSMGTTLILQHAEILFENRTLNRLNLRLANATDVYVCKGGGGDDSSSVEEFQPYFTYHGFRFASIEVRNSNGAPNQSVADIVTRVRAIVLHSAVKQIGFFNTTHPVLQGIHHMAFWGQRSNLMSIPTDCDQRDERLGWMADAHLSSEEANLNFDLNAFYKSFTVNNMAVSARYTRVNLPDNTSTVLQCLPNIVPSMLDAQPMPSAVEGWGYPGDPAWISAFTIIPLATYKASGDPSALAQIYDSLTLYTEFQATLTNATTGLADQGGFGDWNALSKVNWTLVGTSYLYGMQSDMAEIAKILDKPEDEVAKWEELANKTKDNFNKAFFDASSCSYQVSNWTLGRQSANAIPLYKGLVPSGKENCVADTLASYVTEGDLCPSGNGSRCFVGHLSVGIVGAQALLPALSANGHHDLALKLATTTTFPSWGYWLTKNATTMWEKWSDYINPDGNDSSHNHIMFGSIDVWLYRYYAGLVDQRNRVADCRRVCSLDGHTVEAAVHHFRIRHEPILDTTTNTSLPDDDSVKRAASFVSYRSIITGGRTVKRTEDSQLLEIDENTVHVLTQCRK